MSVRTATRLAAALLGAALLSVIAAPLAGAQDPYGSTTTTTAPVREVGASCGLSLSKGKPGDTVTAQVSGVFYNERVRILFDTVQVAEVTAPPKPVVAQSAGRAVVFNGSAVATADPDSTTVSVKFTVPKSAKVGVHTVSAVGDTFTCFCNPKGEFTVVGASGGRSLARTGVEAALLIVIAVALLVLGRGFVEASRHRRRAAALAATDEDERTLASAGR